MPVTLNTRLWACDARYGLALRPYDGNGVADDRALIERDRAIGDNCAGPCGPDGCCPAREIHPDIVGATVEDVQENPGHVLGDKRSAR